MKFMVMHKMTPEMETGAPPDPAIIEGVGKLVSEGAKDGVFVSGEGLKPSSQRTLVVYENGKRTTTEGPFADPKELAAGFALMRVRSKDEALAWCDRFGALLGDVRLILGPVVEPWDLGIMPKPANAPLRYLSIHQLDARSADEAPLDPDRIAKMGALIEEMTAAGVLQKTAALASPKKGARVRFASGTHTVLDGPFAESKELVAGYAILELPSKEAAVEWAVRFGHVVRVNEVEIRPLEE